MGPAVASTSAWSAGSRSTAAPLAAASGQSKPRLSFALFDVVSVADRECAAALRKLEHHLLDLALDLQKKFKDKVAPVSLKIECSPWMDGTTMLKHACGMATWSMRLLGVDGKKVSEIVDLGKKELDALMRPRPAFFGWCKETRSFGETVATIMGVQLRQAYFDEGFVIPINGQAVKIYVVGGKLRGDLCVPCLSRPIVLSRFPS